MGIPSQTLTSLRLCYDAATVRPSRLCGRTPCRTRGAVRLVSAAVLLAVSSCGFAATIAGHIDLTSEGKPLRAEEAQDSIVYFRPKVPMQAVPVTPPQEMSTVRKQFVPRVLATTVGSEVRFPNQDPILHNAFSTSKDNGFDVG